MKKKPPAPSRTSRSVSEHRRKGFATNYDPRAPLQVDMSKLEDYVGPAASVLHDMGDTQPKQVSGARKTGESGNNPKDRYGEAKVDFNCLPQSSLVIMALAMQCGAADYGFQNYRVEKVKARVYLGAADRHLKALIDGEDIDPKRGIHHAGFIMATVGIYLDAMLNGNLIDDRVVPGVTGELISLFNGVPGQPKATPAELKVKLQQFLGRYSYEVR